MRLKWKIFLAMLLVVLMTLSISAAFLISVIFQGALNREKDAAVQQNQILRATVATLLTSVSKTEWEENSGEVLRKLIEDIDGFPQENFFIRLRLEDQVIYEKVACPESDEAKKPQPAELVQTLQLAQSGHWIETVSMLEINGCPMYLESWQDVSGLFTDRENQYRLYQIVILAAVVGTGLLSLVIAAWIARPVSRLSQVVRSITEGNAGARADIRSLDEVGLLAQDVNQMADRLEADIACLQETNERQERFIGNFAHELKTPLTSIIGYADMLRLRKAEPEFTMEAAGYIYSEGKRLERLSAKLLQGVLLRQEALERRKLSAANLLQKTAEVVQPVLAEKKLVLHQETEGDILLWGDEDLLQTVLLNLVDNARKACAEGGNIWMKARKDKDEAVIEVRDDGCGAAEEELSRLTEAFYMEDKSRSRSQGGSGLGLYLCAEIVKLHEGRLRFESSPGRGMKVEVILPTECSRKGEQHAEG